MNSDFQTRNFPPRTGPHGAASPELLVPPFRKPQVTLNLQAQLWCHILSSVASSVVQMRV